MSLAKYTIIVLGIAGGSLALLWPIVLGSLDARERWAALTGSALATGNALVAHGLVLWGRRRSTPAFLGAVLWGMVGRMAVLLAAFAGAILYLKLPHIPLTASLLSYFVVFLFLELIVFHRRSREAQAQ